VQVALGAGARFDVPVPEGAREEASEALPALDVSTVPGAVVVARRGFALDGGAALRVACVRAPSSGWAPGVEELVLARAGVLARAAVPGLERWDERPATCDAKGCEQRLDGRVVRAGEGVTAAKARHVLGFVGDRRDAVLCTVACAEPEGGARCEAAVAGARPVGFVAAPSPSLVVRAVLLAAEHPRGAGALVGAVGLAVVAWILARRPRPRP
jgi:hypothetical protein